MAFWFVGQNGFTPFITWKTYILNCSSSPIFALWHLGVHRLSPHPLGNPGPMLHSSAPGGGHMILFWGYRLDLVAWKRRVGTTWSNNLARNGCGTEDRRWGYGRSRVAGHCDQGPRFEEHFSILFGTGIVFENQVANYVWGRPLVCGKEVPIALLGWLPLTGMVAQAGKPSCTQRHSVTDFRVPKKQLAYVPYFPTASAHSWPNQIWP